MSGGNRMDPSTQVPAATGVCGRLRLCFILYALNGLATRGSQFWGQLLGTGNP
jgi:hypothetical protein